MPTARPLILHFFAVTGLGGSELGALGAMRRQPGFSHRLLFIEPRGTANALYEEAGFATACLDLGAPHGWWGVRRGLQAALGAWRPALVHTYGLRPSLLVRLERRRPPLVQSVHSIDEYRPAWQRWLDRLSAQRVDLYLANSETGARFIAARRGVPRARLRVVENGIELEAYAGSEARRAAVRRDLGLAADQPAILTVANLRAPKGLDQLVGAARILAGTGQRFTWLVAGNGPQEGWLRAAIDAAGLAERVRLLGFRRDVPALLAAADLFCLTSTREGVPVAIVEAMAAGRPVVATDVGGIGELVLDGETGILLPPGEPLAIAAAIEHLLADAGLRARLAAGGRRRARARFGVERAAARIAGCYRELLGEDGG